MEERESRLIYCNNEIERIENAIRVNQNEIDSIRTKLISSLNNGAELDSSLQERYVNLINTNNRLSNEIAKLKAEKDSLLNVSSDFDDFLKSMDIKPNTNKETEIDTKPKSDEQLDLNFDDLFNDLEAIVNSHKEDEVKETETTEVENTEEVIEQPTIDTTNETEDENIENLVEENDYTIDDSFSKEDVEDIENTIDNDDLDENEEDDEEEIENTDKELSDEDLNKKNSLMNSLNNRLKDLKKEKKELLKRKKENDTTAKDERRIEEIKSAIKNIELCKKALRHSDKDELDKTINLINNLLRSMNAISLINNKNELSQADMDNIRKLREYKYACNHELKKVTHSKDVNKKRAAIIVGVAGISAIVILSAILLHKKGNNNSNSHETNNDADYTIDTNDIENIPSEDDLNDAFTYLKLQLIDKGYTPYVANLLAQNGDEQLIFTLLNLDYVVEPIESYTKAKNFDITRIADYEDARIRYNLSGEDAVDIANRAIDLYNVGYFNNSNRDLTTLYNVLIAIRDKNIFFDENRETHQAIVNELFQISNKVMNNSLTDIDLNKVAALPLFAKEGSDLRAHLEQVAPLYVENFRNPGNTENNEKLYRHYLATTYGFGGTLADSSYSSGDQNFDNNAILEDAYDYFISSLVFQAGLQSGVTAHMDWELNHDAIVRWSNLEEVQNELFKSSNYCEQQSQSR